MPTDLLTRPPEMAVSTINEVLSIADALERAAVARYSALGAAMRRIGHANVASVFESLAAEEQSHVESVRSLSVAVLSGPPTAEITRWVLPETFGAEETGPPALLTPYKALSIAVRGEERAFAFWTYVASNAASVPVRDQAEQMARQELIHAAKLRHARRRAFHLEHPEKRGETDRRSSIHLLAARQAVIQLQTEATGFLSAAADRLDQLADAGNAALLRAIVAEIIADGRPGAAQSGRFAERMEWSATIGPAGILFEAVGALERLAENCLDIMEHSADATATDEFQNLVDRTTQQVARLNAQLYAMEPSLAAIATESSPDRPAAR